MAENVVLALSAEHIVRLTGLTMRQLRYWDNTGFFKAASVLGDGTSPYSHVYSFRDAVGLRTISVLLKKYRVSLPHLRQVAKKLSAHSAAPWSDIKLWVLNRKVQFEDPDTGKPRGVVDGQYVFLPIIDVIDEVNRGIETLKERETSQIGKFEKNRYVSHNSVVVAGTRIPVRAVLEYLDRGYSAAAIVGEYPTLTEGDVMAVAQNGRTATAA